MPTWVGDLPFWGFVLLGDLLLSACLDQPLTIMNIHGAHTHKQLAAWGVNVLFRGKEEKSPALPSSPSTSETSSQAPSCLFQQRGTLHLGIIVNLLFILTTRFASRIFKRPQTRLNEAVLLQGRVISPWLCWSGVELTLCHCDPLVRWPTRNHSPLHLQQQGWTWLRSY